MAHSGFRLEQTNLRHSNPAARFLKVFIDRSGSYWTSVRSGFPFSTMYVENAALLPLPTFFAVWTVPAGTNKTSPALSVTGGWPSS